MAGKSLRDEYLLKNKHFSCTECGKCCTGSGVVWANRAELEAIRAIVDPDATLEEFIAAYADVDEMVRRQVDLESKEWFILKNAENKMHGVDSCIFLDPETNHCAVYRARPLQCSTYPWWPELISSSQEWRDEGIDVCEGIMLDGEEACEDPTRAVTPLDEKLSKLNSFVAYLEDFPYKDTYH